MIHKLPEEYHVGDIAYTLSGDKVQITAIGDQGYCCHFVYVDGERKGKAGYIAEVNWLFVDIPIRS